MSWYVIVSAAGDRTRVAMMIVPFKRTIDCLII